MNANRGNSALRFSHLVNAFLAPPESSHARAQTITFASMQTAVVQARTRGIGVEVLAITFPSDAAAVGAPARPVPALTRSVINLANFSKPRPLPLLGDILHAAEGSCTGEYCIYSNIDIALQPHFYIEVDRLLRNGRGLIRAMAINRRTIDARFRSVDDLTAAYSEKGVSHPGYDCFVFPREWLARIRLAHVCVGMFWFDLLMLANLDLLSGYRFAVYKDLRLTFHIGDDANWVRQDDYARFNAGEARTALEQLREEHRPHCLGSWFDWLEHKLEGRRPIVRRALLETRQSALIKASAVLGKMRRV